MESSKPNIVGELDPFLPIYQSIKNFIRDKIESGELKRGDRLPSEQQLADELGVSRGQTRQALRDLDQEGYLVRSPGRGTFVAGRGRRRLRADEPSTQVIQVCMPDNTHAYYCRCLIDGFRDCATEHDMHAVFFYSQFGELEKELDFLGKFSRDTAKGLALWPPAPTYEVVELVRGLLQALPRGATWGCRFS